MTRILTDTNGFKNLARTDVFIKDPIDCAQGDRMNVDFYDNPLLESLLKMEHGLHGF